MACHPTDKVSLHLDTKNREGDWAKKKKKKKLPFNQNSTLGEGQVGGPQRAVIESPRTEGSPNGEVNASFPPFHVVT